MTDQEQNEYEKLHLEYKKMYDKCKREHPNFTHLQIMTYVSIAGPMLDPAIERFPKIESIYKKIVHKKCPYCHSYDTRCTNLGDKLMAKAMVTIGGMVVGAITGQSTSGASGSMARKNCQRYCYKCNNCGYDWNIEA